MNHSTERDPSDLPTPCDPAALASGEERSAPESSLQPYEKPSLTRLGLLRTLTLDENFSFGP